MEFNGIKMPNFDRKSNWKGIQRRVQRRFYAQSVTVLSVIFIGIFGYQMMIQQGSGKLYDGTKFEKIAQLEEDLEKELEMLQDDVVEIQENPRYFALIEQVNNINHRLEECKAQITRNPLNPNFHRVYLSLLKSKRNALVILNEMKG